MNCAILLSAVFVITASAPALAQAPVVTPGGVVNAATYATTGEPGNNIAPGSLASIFGQNLASGTASASSLPLPQILSGTSVTFDGIPAPLLYVSPGQINVQVPSELGANGKPTVSVIVKTLAGQTDPSDVPIAFQSLGIFTTDASRCGRGAVFNVTANGAVSLNTPSNSVSPGGIITMYGNGLGVRLPSMVGTLSPDGVPSPSAPLVKDTVGTDFLLANPAFNVPEYNSPLFAGKAPGWVGLDQFNVQVPDDAPEGCSIPLRLRGRYSASVSQPVPLSIRRGGGQCVDPSPDSIALLTWKKIVTAGAAVPAELLSIEFLSAIGIRPPKGLAEVGQCSNAQSPPQGPSCTWAEDKHLDAGTLWVQDQAGRLIAVATPVMIDNQPRYSLNLPPGTIGPGRFIVRGFGGKDVGPFTTSVTIPPAIRLATTFPNGISYTEPATVTWTGGASASVVRFDLTVSPVRTIGGQVLAECAATAPAGSATLPTIDLCGNCPSLPLPHGPVETTVTQEPAESSVQTFQAPGLTLGGRHTWVYEFRFPGLVI